MLIHIEFYVCKHNQAKQSLIIPKSTYAVEKST